MSAEESNAASATEPTQNASPGPTRHRRRRRSLWPETAGPWPWWLGHHPLLALTAILAVWGLVDVRGRGRIEPDNLVEHRTDFTVYTEAGAACFDGRDPYAVTNARGWGYLYPPLLAILVAPLAALDPEWQVTIWFFISLLCLWGCYHELSRLVDWLADAPLKRAGAFPPSAQNQHSLRPPHWLPWAAAIAAALPTLNCLQRGQVGLLQLYLLLAGFRWLMAPPRAGQKKGDILVFPRGIGWRATRAGLVFALALVIKLTAALPVGLILVERWTAARCRRTPIDRRKAMCCTGGFVLGLALWILVVPAAAIGWQRNLDCLGRWCSLVPTKVIDTGADLFAGDSSSVRNQSLTNAARHLGNWITEDLVGGGRLRPAEREPQRHAMEAPVVGRVLVVARLGLLGLMVGIAIWAGRKREELASASQFGLGLVATLAISPVARTHYFLLLAPAVLWTPWYLHRAGRRQWAGWLAWTPTALVVPQYLWPEVFGGIGWLGVGMTVWLVTAAILLCIASRRRGVTILAWRVSAGEATLNLPAAAKISHAGSIREPV